MTTHAGPARLALAGLLALSLASAAAATAVSASDGLKRDAADLPACAYADEHADHAAYADWKITLVDTIERIPAGYAPRDLVPVSHAGIAGAGSVRRLVIADLSALARAARRAGAPLRVESAYRSYRTQVGTFAGWVRASGRSAALRASARPGHSEHQLGTAIDFSSGGRAPWSYDDWATTRAGAWMAGNAWKYGFVLSYPKDAMSRTCYQYEPWHYRYVGRAAAAAIHSGAVTTREWLWEQR